MKQTNKPVVGHKYPQSQPTGGRSWRICDGELYYSFHTDLSIRFEVTSGHFMTIARKDPDRL